MFKRGVMVFILTCALQAQEGSTVNNTEGPPYAGWTMLMFYLSGTSNVEYVCQAKGVQPSYSFSVSGGTLTSIVDAVNTATVTTAAAHGLLADNTVTISGATGDADLNGSYSIITVPTATTFTVTTVNVTDTTYNNSSLAIATTAPRSTAAVWSIQKMVYSGDNLIRKQWAFGVPSPNRICDNRAQTTGNTRVAYQ